MHKVISLTSRCGVCGPHLSVGLKGIAWGPAAQFCFLALLDLEKLL